MTSRRGFLGALAALVAMPKVVGAMTTADAGVVYVGDTPTYPRHRFRFRLTPQQVAAWREQHKRYMVAKVNAILDSQ